MKQDKIRMRGGFTLVEIMIIVTIIATLAAIAIPHLLRAKINANQTAAQATLRTISGACESYASANSGNFPTSMDQLVNSGVKYLNEDYTSVTREGYNFNCSEMTVTGYNCTATPVQCGYTATKNFTIITGGVLTDTACE